MSLVQDLTPINLEEEKQKFFDSNFKYNPQFRYNTLITSHKLYKYGKPKPEIVELAKQLLEKAFHNRTEEELRKMEGNKIDKTQANLMINQFLKENKIKNQIKVKWSKDFPGKASFYIDTLKLKLPVWHREKEFLGTIYHELGTHALRRINYTQQPFFKKKAKYGFKDYMVTEEGLASFHTLLAKNFKIDYMGALKYCACEIARGSSFAKTYDYVKKYLQDPERAWLYTYHQKRGLYDTSQGGGFTKNIVYLEGLIQVWNYLQKNSFDVESLYLGKINIEDVAKAKEMSQDSIILIPTFIKNDLGKYASSIVKIAKLNHLND